MAVTHADLAPGPRSTDLGSKTGAFLMVLSILCGLFCFILCLFAEATRSKVTWVSMGSNEGKGEKYECVYNGSGKTPLLCGAGAFGALAIAMVVEHTYMLVAVSKSPPPALVTWDPDHSGFTKTLTWQAAFFFVTTWMCFAVGEILLLIGLSVESGHLKNWSTPNTSCLIIGEGLFSAAGVFGLMTVFLASGLYFTALRAQNISQEHQNMRQEMIQTSILFASPPASPPHRPIIATDTSQNPINTQHLNQQLPPDNSIAFNKYSNLV